MTKRLAILGLSFLFGAGCALAEPAASAPPAGFVSREGSRLMLDGKEYRAIGVNMPNLAQSCNGTWFHDIQIYGSEAKARAAMIDGLDDAEKSGFKFVRFFASPGYPADIDKLYIKDRAAYWRSMDDVVQLAASHHLRLIPSLGITLGCGFNNYYGEPKQAILDPKSQTYRAAHDYVREFVTRYKDSPVILMWELQNETMLEADVDAQGRPGLPGGVFTDKKARRPILTRADSLTWDMIQQLYREQAAFIRSLDSNHLVDSGDAAVRREGISRRETFPNFKYRNDTYAEWVGSNLVAQGGPFDAVSYHLYGSFTTDPKKNWGMSDMDWIGGLLDASHAAGMPIYIGEFGARGYGKDDPATPWQLQFIDHAEQQGVSLISLWVWHFAWQKNMTLDSGNVPALVKRCAEFNRKYAGDR